MKEAMEPYDGTFESMYFLVHPRMLNLSRRQRNQHVVFSLNVDLKVCDHLYRHVPGVSIMGKYPNQIV